ADPFECRDIRGGKQRRKLDVLEAGELPIVARGQEAAIGRMEERPGAYFIQLQPLGQRRSRSRASQKGDSQCGELADHGTSSLRRECRAMHLIDAPMSIAGRQQNRLSSFNDQTRLAVLTVALPKPR